jgi:hypothetical protein
LLFGKHDRFQTVELRLKAHASDLFIEGVELNLTFGLKGLLERFPNSWDWRGLGLETFPARGKRLGSSFLVDANSTLVS